MKKTESGINVITGRKVVKIDAARQEARLDNGSVIKYDKCLLATGGKPKVGTAHSLPRPHFISNLSEFPTRCCPC